MKINFYQWLQIAQYTLLAPRCLLCRAPASLTHALCKSCHDELPRISAACDYCALPLPANSYVRCCPDCRSHPHFDAAVGACCYIQPLPWLITQLKFAEQLHHAPVLGNLLAEAVEQSGLTVAERLIPVPLHNRAYRRRGFNQAERIASRLGQRLNRPVATAVAIRQRDTHAQSGLDAARRAANVRGAFAVNGSLDGQHVAIVDDVVTTTRTATALADCLRAAGAARVDVYCVARA